MAPDPSADRIDFKARPLGRLFDPKTIAVLGASESEGRIGRTLLENLLSGGKNRKIFPVNPAHPRVLGLPCFASIRELPIAPDLVVIATPAKTVPDLVWDCVAKGVGAAIIISAGFKETGEAGKLLEEQILKSSQGKMLVLGPNCLGLMNPTGGLNATFDSRTAKPGKIAFLSQSGALCSAILDWSLHENVGFSAFVSTGSMLDVGWGDLIAHLGKDPETQSILIYMESVGDAHSFLSAARGVAGTKPIIVLKTGRTPAAAKAAISHTGSLTGSDEVLDAAFRRVGILRVNRIGELFDMAEVLAKQPRPKGVRLGILTNAGGAAVLATDRLSLEGGSLAELTPPTIGSLDAFLPAHWSRGNPVDIIGDADPERYRKAFEILQRDPAVHGLLVILSPQAMTDPTGVAQILIKELTASRDKPILASWMGAGDVAAGEALLNQAGVPTYSYPDDAAQAFQFMVRYAENLKLLSEAPSLTDRDDRADKPEEKTRPLLQKILAEGRTLLMEDEAKEVLRLWGLPALATRAALSEEEAVHIAEEMGYPVVLKLRSPTVTHKSDVGGVLLNLANADDVRKAFIKIRTSLLEKKGPGDFAGVTVQPMIPSEGYELILGSSFDHDFGPILLFGSGGPLVEVYQDRALGLPPLTATLADQLIQKTRIDKALRGIRGRPPVDREALIQVLIRFSRLIVNEPRIREIEINPLLVSADRILALDARAVLLEQLTPPDFPS